MSNYLFRSLEDDRTKNQKNAFETWINFHLLKISLHIDDLFVDLRDGRKLLLLLGQLTGQTFVLEKRNMRAHRLVHLMKVLNCLGLDDNYHGDIGPEEIVDGNPSSTLRVVQTIIRQYHIDNIKYQVKNIKSTSWMHGKHGLLAWCKDVLAPYSNVKVEGFGASWKNGLAFNALLHTRIPEHINYASLDPTQHTLNLANAFQVAESVLGIPRILTVENFFSFFSTDLHLINLQLSSIEELIVIYVGFYFYRFEWDSPETCTSTPTITSAGLIEGPNAAVNKTELPSHSGTSKIVDSQVKDCGVGFSTNSKAYRCHTCELSEAMCLCEACFQKGPHSQHAFELYSPSIFDFCDCGDKSLMKSIGFCYDHGGQSVSHQEQLVTNSTEGYQPIETDKISNRAQESSFRHFELPVTTGFYNNVKLNTVQFHQQTKGRHVEIHPSGFMAKKSFSHMNFASNKIHGYIFTDRSIALGQSIVIGIQEDDTLTSGSDNLGFGMTSCNPSNISFIDLPEDPEFLLDRSEYWIVFPNVFGALSLNRAPPNSITNGTTSYELCVTLLPTGDVTLSRNGCFPVTLMCVDTTVPLWVFFKLPKNNMLAQLYGTIEATGTATLTQTSGKNDGDTRINNPSSLPNPTTPSEPLQSQYPDPIPSAPSLNELTEDPPMTVVPAAQAENKSETKGAECMICCEAQSNSVFIPCGHICMCHSCGLQYLENKKKERLGEVCPICRVKCTSIVKTYTT